MPSNAVTGEPTKDSRQGTWQCEFRQAVQLGERRGPSWKQACLGGKCQASSGRTRQLGHWAACGNSLSRVRNNWPLGWAIGHSDWISLGVHDIVAFSKFSPSDAKTWPSLRKPTGSSKWYRFCWIVYLIRENPWASPRHKALGRLTQRKCPRLAASADVQGQEARPARNILGHDENKPPLSQEPWQRNIADRGFTEWHQRYELWPRYWRRPS